MDFLTDLWLPILLSAVFDIIARSILHMVIPIHKGDYKKIPGEDLVLAEMRAQGLQPGEYMLPCASCMKDMASPEMIETFNQGPVGFLTVVPSGPITWMPSALVDMKRRESGGGRIWFPRIVVPTFRSCATIAIPGADRT